MTTKLALRGLSCLPFVSIVGPKASQLFGESFSKEEGLDFVFTFRFYKVKWRPAAKVFLEEYLVSVAEQKPKPFWGFCAKLAARWGEDASWNSRRLRGKATAPVPGACGGESPVKPECECEALERSVLERATRFPKSPFFSLHWL